MIEDFLEASYDKFTFRVEKGLLYHPEECWVQEESGGVTVGVTDFLQKTAGDVALLELPPAGADLIAGGPAGTLETIKATVTLISPLSGRIQEVNPALDDEPQLINTDPYGEGWVFKVQPADWAAERRSLWDAETYFRRMEEKIRQEMARK